MTAASRCGLARIPARECSFPVPLPPPYYIENIGFFDILFEPELPMGLAASMVLALRRQEDDLRQPCVLHGPVSVLEGLLQAGVIF
jgi:hypothetical protein